MAPHLSTASARLLLEVACFRLLEALDLYGETFVHEPESDLCNTIWVASCH